MKRGLVIGKFMPVHQGHRALIDFAVSHCDELIISMSYTSSDPIPGELRFSWLCEILRDQPAIKVSIVEDNFDDDTLPWPERTALWSAFIKRVYPPIHILFSSEEYGEPFSKNLGVEHQPFDPQRTKNQVSATLIRQHPFRYWNFIPEQVRPFFVKKLCFYGPESTGKSTLAKLMAEKYQTEFVPEVARELITSNDFTADDIVAIGYAQLKRVQEKAKTANKILFCDTDAITTEIYSMHYLKVVPPVLYQLEKEIVYDHYFLFDIDVPWVKDHLRDLSDKRAEMMTVFKKELDDRNIRYTLIQGTWEQRAEQVTEVVEKIFTSD